MAKKNDGRRKPNTGYTTQAKNETWTAYYPKLGGGYHVRRGFTTKALAEAWLDSLVTQSQGKIDVAKGQWKTSAWAERWIERTARENDWKAKMKADVIFKVEYTTVYIGDMALADVMPDDIDLMLDDLSKDLAQNTIRQIRNYLYRIFEAARERRYITFNPVIKPGRRKRPKQKEPVRLTLMQSATVIRAAESSFYFLAWWFILTLGLRAGEVCGLRWGDVDLENGVLHVLQEVTDLRGKAHQDTPKNDKIRHLPIARALIPLFELHRKTLLKRAAKGMTAGTWQEHGLVFPGRSGRPMNPNSLRHMLHDLTDACKLPPVTIHMLRHTAAKFYTDQQTPDNVTGAILGHTPNITGHYAPPDAEAMRPWVEQVWRRLSGEVEKVQRATG